MDKKLAQELIDFIYESPTQYHCASEIKKELQQNGFVEIKEADKWDIKKNGKYFVVKNDSAVIAFEIGNGEIEEHGFRLIGAHTDSPGFRIKPNCEMKTENHYVRLNTEVYGGPIFSTWFDRPLSIAGRVIVKGESPIEPNVKLVNINKPVIIIPNVAIHMNREVNTGFNINAQKDTLPLAGFVNESFEKNGYLVNLISEYLGIAKEEIIDFDLFLYEHEKGCIMGIEEEFISTSRLDDQWMIFAGIKGLLDSKENKCTKVMVCIDNEEIGSLTQQGARSSVLKNTLERICLSLGKNKEEFFRAMSNSIMVSADLAHAIHPNNPEKHDPTNRPLLGNGPVIKFAAGGSYSTDSYSSAVFTEICKSAEVPYQVFVNRSDVRGGSTIGALTSADLAIPVVDMGAPILAMHSIRELATVKDNAYTVKVFTEFFNV